MYTLYNVSSGFLLRRKRKDTPAAKKKTHQQQIKRQKGKSYYNSCGYYRIRGSERQKLTRLPSLRYVPVMFFVSTALANQPSLTRLYNLYTFRLNAHFC